jgi:serine/threonine-protein kinase
LPESLEQRDSAVVSSAGEPGPLSRLLQEIFEAPSEDLLEGWKRELQPGDRLGRFEIRREVGRGGFGAVYEAFDTELNRVVAVKTLRLSRPRRDLSSDWIKKEAEAVARLDHPCIVTLFDVGTCDSGPYLVMELLRGKTLAQRIAEGPVAVAEALRIAEEMAKGLTHAHQRGVLHRDLKPANVFLCEDGRVKLLDFGLAHLLGTEGVSGAGTPAYMAPEQARGEEVDQRADVYAAGSVLGDMLGERRPRRLERAIAIATSTDPAARPRDGQAWLDVLQTVRRAVERPARMRRVAVLAGLGVVLGGVVVGVMVDRASRPVAAAHGQPSIAVLPFADLSPGKDQEYLSNGVAEEILNALARVPGLWVPGRTSSFYFKGKDAKLEHIGRELRVDHVLQGSVRRSGSKVRVSAEVVKIGTGERVWSQSFDRELTDIFAIQDEIARSAVDALRVKLLHGQQALGREYRPKSQEAYQSYLLGAHFAQSFSGDSQKRAIAALEKAVESDPGFASAWATLARAKIAAGTINVIPWFDARRDALIAANRAVELAPDLPEAIAARAYSKLSEWDWTGAKTDIDLAIERWPDDPASIRAMAYHAYWMGRIPEAVDLTRRYLDKEPLDGAGWNALGVGLGWIGQYADADRAFARALEVDPRNDFAVANRGKNLVDAGRPAEGLATCQKADPGDMDRLGCEALAYHALGNPSKAQEALDGMLADPRGDRLFFISRVFACRGEKDLAFDWLEKARIAHVRSLNGLLGNPCFRPLHSDPRWAELLRKMNLPVD